MSLPVLPPRGAEPPGGRDSSSKRDDLTFVVAVGIGVLLLGAVVGFLVGRVTAPDHPAKDAPHRANRATPTVTVPAAASTTTLPSLPEVEDCGTGLPELRPRQVTLSCGGANELATDLTWNEWAPTQATATGLESWNSCVPNCAQSTTWDSSAATFKLSFPVATPQGLLFTILNVDVVGPSAPGNIRTSTLNEAPKSAPPSSTTTPPLP
jgi:hypothetical protein